jgi:peptidoglycan/xylan/chitin deacetylase (PgdA/CDA1 family)
MLSWDEYRHLLGSGLVDIGCHTHDLHTFSHRGALGVSAQRMEEDLNTFSGTLWRETGTSTDILSWPYGLYDGKSISVAKKAGFRYFLTSKDEPFAVTGSLEEIPRRTVNKHHDLVSFRGVVEGRQ